MKEPQTRSKNFMQPIFASLTNNTTNSWTYEDTATAELYDTFAPFVLSLEAAYFF